MRPVAGSGKLMSRGADATPAIRPLGSMIDDRVNDKAGLATQIVLAALALGLITVIVQGYRTARTRCRAAAAHLGDRGGRARGVRGGLAAIGTGWPAGAVLRLQQAGCRPASTGHLRRLSFRERLNSEIIG